jgi:hypothetical protein
MSILPSFYMNILISILCKQSDGIKKIHTFQIKKFIKQINKAYEYKNISL